MEMLHEQIASMHWGIQILERDVKVVCSKSTMVDLVLQLLPQRGKNTHNIEVGGLRIKIVV